MINESQFIINYHNVRNLFMNQNITARIVTNWMTDRDGDFLLGLLSVWVLELICRRYSD
jgi:hypothetical protein